MNVYLIRHGQTDANVRGAYNGRLNEPLCGQGIAGLRGRSYPVADLLFASPMLRCIQTAAQIYPELAPALIEDLRERDFGDFEGMTHAEITAQKGFENWGMTAELMRFPNAEEFDPFFVRCERGFFEAVRAAEGQNAERIAIVCHGGVIRGILSRLYNGSFYDWGCENGGGFLLDWQNGKIQSVTGLFA